MARKQPTRQEKLVSALLALDEARCKLDPTLKACIDRERAKTLTAQEIERQMGIEWAHVVHVAWDGDNHPTNLVPMRKADHRRATEKTDIPAIAKTKRIQKKEAAHKARRTASDLHSEWMKDPEYVREYAKATRELRKQKWPSRPMAGTKKSGLKRSMSGNVSKR